VSGDGLQELVDDINDWCALWHKVMDLIPEDSHQPVMVLAWRNEDGTVDIGPMP
jgi:hypothetical protein